jgi:hypothetical protein
MSQEDVIKMLFNRCECKACRTIAVATVTFLVVYPIAYGDECWDKPQVRLYCQSLLPEQPHDHHGDQRPLNEQRTITITSSIASSNNAVTNLRS